MSETIVTFESCTADVFYEDKIMSIQSIMSKAEGKGHATECLKKIEVLAKTLMMDEIWYPTVINPKLEKILLKLGYTYTNFGKHPMMPDGGDVMGYKKVLT